MSAVTRRDLATALKESHGGTISAHDQWIQAFIDILSQKISEHGKVELRGFGSFHLNTIKAHTTIDPSTTQTGGEPKKLEVPETYTVDFRPSGSYKNRLRAEQKKRKASAKSKTKAKSRSKKRKPTK